MLAFDEVLSRLPSLKNLLDTHGTMSLFEYAKKYYHVPLSESPLLESRKKELLNFLDGYVTRKFGKNFSEIVIDALSRNYAVSTAEHHGPMGHPFFFQSALLRAISQPELPVINFATSHVSLGNSSYPRGLVFHGDGKAAPKEYLHLPFFGSKSRMCPVFQYVAYTQTDIEEHCIQRLCKYHREQLVSDEMYGNILRFIQRNVLSPSVLALRTYSEQITQLNYKWWKELFSEMPPYISLDAEDMVAGLLQKHLQNNTSFSRVLTDMDLQPNIENHFNGIACCFDLDHYSGTYLFWYLDEHHRRHALWREENELVSQDKSFRIKMTQEEYLYHLEHKHLIPSGLLVYTLFTCYYGVTCFGGFAQGEYLTQIQRAYHTTMNTPDAEGIIQPPILNEDMVFLYGKNGFISTALDIQNYPRDSVEVFLASQKTLLSDSIQAMEYEIERCF